MRLVPRRVFTRDSTLKMLRIVFTKLKMKLFKSGNPKISRIGRQERKNIFLLFSPKEPIWLTIFGNDIKRFDFLFVYSKFAKPENTATGPSTAAMRLEIWHMFNTLVRTHQTLP